MREYLHQGQQRGEPDLVVLAGDAFLQVLHAGFPPALSDYLARHGNLDTQELVAFAILSRPGLEKPGETGDLGRVGMGLDFGEKPVHFLTEGPSTA